MQVQTHSHTHTHLLSSFSYCGLKIYIWTQYMFMICVEQCGILRILETMVKCLMLLIKDSQVSYR